MEFRTLRADEIDCRIQSVSKGKNGVGAIVLLYKDARVDMNMLDEVVGAMNWKRQHEVIDGNLYCTVSIRNPETGDWISKQDVGTESNTEKEKGQASDSFKRACFNWGIGRELYTAPLTWVSLDNAEYVEQNGKYKSYLKLRVSHIEYDEKRSINKLVIVDTAGKIRFHYNNLTPKEERVKKHWDDLVERAKAKTITEVELFKHAKERFNVAKVSQLKDTEINQLREWIAEL